LFLNQAYAGELCNTKFREETAVGYIFTALQVELKSGQVAEALACALLAVRGAV